MPDENCPTSFRPVFTRSTTLSAGLDALREQCARDVPELREQLEILARRKAPVETALIRRTPGPPNRAPAPDPRGNVHSLDLGTAAIGGDQRREHFEQRRLSRAVVSQQTEKLAAPNFERHGVDAAVT